MSSLEILENASEHEPFWLGQKDDDLRHVFKAIDQGDLGVLRWLAGFGAVRMAEPNSGLTPLMYAVARSRPDMVCLLIPHSELEQADEYGMTALLVASCNGNAVCLKALIPVSDLKAVDALTGKTALMNAADRGFADCVELLLPGSQCDAVDASGMNAATLARMSGHGDIADQIESYRARMERDSLMHEVGAPTGAKPSRACRI